MTMIGLTGGIASGKSTAARRLREHGAVLIDADAVVRELQGPGGAAIEPMVEAFGSGILGPDGALDRPALGRRVFADPQARERLNAIVHPLVRERSRELVEQARAKRPGAVIVRDIPLLVETGQAEEMDLVLVIEAPREQRIRRMVEDRGMSPEDAAARIDAQATDAQRREAADDVLVNDGTVAELVAAVDAWWERRVP
ncbi:dephospho-CoA kinase [Kocuria palustris]|uniref:dephospho-CoA kinase n=1 Tax=Kocuria palustris TaxID=71999 RepID=UPI0011A60FC4|nr:dephospho-CoA kinase [Kocuria palustris]